MFLNVARLLSRLHELIRVRPRPNAVVAASPPALQSVKCKQCGVSFSVPDPSAKQRSTVATLVRANRLTLAGAVLHSMISTRSRWPIIFQVFMREKTQVTRDCMEVTRHITRSAGFYLADSRSLVLHAAVRPRAWFIPVQCNALGSPCGTCLLQANGLLHLA
jgi:hypothetical protein